MTFPDFFTALWSTPDRPRPPFPWQDMLAGEAVWPAAIDLPTASGKTACIDAAVYRLATGAAGGEAGTPMPRRIWFVVDRRIVVDEAFERATAIAKKLHEARLGPLRDIADRLTTLSGTHTPLAVARLRGGVWSNDIGWASDPRQPAIICTTVDQLGSSLLFRAYGHGNLTASVYAGLAGNDSLIILDEAHCSEPFRQTLEAIRRFRRQPWSVDAPPVPLACTIMSATLPEALQKHAFPPHDRRDAALNHPELQKRSVAEKWAALRLVKNDDALFEEARKLATEAIAQGRQRVAIMVNRVATAQHIYKLLDQKDAARDAVLITGRMRPLDRDQLIGQWSPVLASTPKREPMRPVVIVTTQCLEVGADFSFDALITECASLDALRQRFGRLDRLGTLGNTQATILLRAEHEKEPDDKEADPIYGKAIHYTWKWLNEIGEVVKVAPSAPATKEPTKSGTGKKDTDAANESPAERLCRVNFSIVALDHSLGTLKEADDQIEPEQKRLPRLLAPQPDAPILLPGHLDLLCQTGPRPAVEPDISLYLHGKGRSSAEVRVVFRADCPTDGSFDALKAHLPALALLPPSSPEGLSVPLHRFHQWLLNQGSSDSSGDVEGESDPLDESDASQPGRRIMPCILWRGRRNSRIATRLTDIHAGDTIVLPASAEIFTALGQLPAQPEGSGLTRLDLAEQAAFQAKGRAILRLSTTVWDPWKDLPLAKALLDCIDNEEAEPDDLCEAIAALLEDELAKLKPTPASPSPATVPLDAASYNPRPLPLPAWLLVLLRRVRRHPFQIERSESGLILISRRRFQGRTGSEHDPFDEDDADERSRASSHRSEVPLTEHTAQVQRLATAFASNRWPAIADVVSRAAFAHDLGKLDPRFQFMLRGGDPRAFDDRCPPLAKSDHLPTGPKARQEIEAALRMPAGFRHEMLSVQLTRHLHLAHGPLDLHLIASHHGHSRPFAPVTNDTAEHQRAAGPLFTQVFQLVAVSAEERAAFTAPHDLSEEHACRFWHLTRRHGWWGLAYAEMLLRLADWQASAHPETKPAAPPPVPLDPPPAKLRTTRDLPGIDGSNPLGALAALGVLRSLTQAWPTRDVRLHWRTLQGGWKAVLSYNAGASDEDPECAIVQAISEILRLGFKPQGEGHEARELAQRDLNTVKQQIEEAKASIKKRKLKGEEKKAAEAAVLEPLKARQAELDTAIVDPTDLAKKAFDEKKTEIKRQVRALKEQKLDRAAFKAARATQIEPLETGLERLRQAWLTLLRAAVPFREMALGKRADVPAAEYREVAEQVLNTAAWWPAEMLAHFGSDGRSDDGITVPTSLSFINGSGHQFFLETALELTKCVTQEKLRTALFAPWVPEDEKYSMRWLPSEDRRYALMASNPSGGEKTLTVWAANLLGYAGLGLLPSAPGKWWLETTGIWVEEKEPTFRWPLWQQPLSALAVSSLFAQQADLSPATIHRQSMRIEIGDGANRKVNFTPSRAL